MKTRIRLLSLLIMTVMFLTLLSGVFSASTEILGDYDGDGFVTVSDARALLSAVTSDKAVTGKAFYRSDMTRDYVISTADVRDMLYAALAGVNTSFEAADKYDGPYSAVNGTFGGTDDLDRTLYTDIEQTDSMSEKTVGIFYFLWQGEHGTGGPYDNSVISQVSGALTSNSGWIAAGGGGYGEHHFWGKPLLDYYVSSDEWVMSRHCQMLTDAGIDYIIVDVTNAFTYTARFMQLAEVWRNYYEQGYDVPKIAFYTNSSSGTTMMNLYNTVYGDARYRDLWFYWDGKPLIIGVSSEASSSLSSYFTIKEAQWPNATKRSNGWPWMEFSRLLTSAAVYGVRGRKEIINVSVAQHCSTVRFSSTAWYGGSDHTRSWHDGYNDSSEDAVLYGYNFAEQWEFALLQDTETIFVTGWNEWVAQRQAAYGREPIVFVDCADPNNSRDVEPMEGLFGDNYYMQMINYIRRYKGTDSRVYVGDYQTIDINGDFSQWDSASVTACYTDYEGDTADRYSVSFGNRLLSDYTGRNDIVSAKVARDYKNIYFYVETAADITSYTDENWMTLFINSGNSGNAAWNGFDYAVNVVSPDNDSSAYLSKCVSDGQWDWSTVSRIEMKIESNRMMISVPRSVLGAEDNFGAGAIDIQFKWADNYQKNDDGTFDVWTFYKNGDAAPYGRTTYIYSEAK